MSISIKKNMSDLSASCVKSFFFFFSNELSCAMNDTHKMPLIWLANSFSMRSQMVNGIEADIRVYINQPGCRGRPSWWCHVISYFAYWWLDTIIWWMRGCVFTHPWIISVSFPVRPAAARPSVCLSFRPWVCVCTRWVMPVESPEIRSKPSP